MCAAEVDTQEMLVHRRVSSAGALGDTGHQGGKHYSVNVPLQEGMDDESYKFVFEPIMQKVCTIYPDTSPVHT